MKKLKLVSFVSIFFIAVQITGGYLANSIAIYTDTAHLGSDMIGFGMSIIALKISLRPASNTLSYGWHRAEVLGTLLSVIFINHQIFYLDDYDFYHLYDYQNDSYYFNDYDYSHYAYFHAHDYVFLLPNGNDHLLNVKFSFELN